MGRAELVMLLWMAALAPACADAPITLSQAVQMAVAQRPELRAAAADVALQDAQVMARRAELRPAVSGSAFGVTQNSGMIYTTTPHVSPTFYSALPPGTLLDLDVMGMLPLYTGGRLEQEVAGALVASHIAREQQTAQVRDIERQARLQYLMALEAQDELRVHQDAVDQDSEALRLAQLQFDTGKAAAITVFRARAAQADEEQARNDAQSQSEQAMVDLKWSLGLAQTADVHLVLDLPAVEPLPDLVALTVQALQTRPDLRAARLQVAVADAQLNASYAPYHPEVDLVGYAQSTSIAGQGLVGGTSLGVTASIPLLDGGLRSSQVDMARANRTKQLALADVATQGVEKDVQKAYVALRTSLTNIELSQRALQAAEENYRIARLRYGLGASIQLEILDAVVSLEKAQLNHFKAIYAYQRARADLDWSIGVGPRLGD